MRHVFLAIFLLVAGSVPGFSAAPRLTYLDESGTRFFKVETLEEGKVRLSFRQSDLSGSGWTWSGTGEQKADGIEFSLKGGEDEPAGLVFLAKATATRLTVKHKPGQVVGREERLSGVYRHVTDEKVDQLAKKEYAALEKSLDEAIKQASLRAPAEDKPGYTEWKKAWPALRDRLIAVSGPKSAAQGPAQAASQPAEMPASHWLQRSKLAAAAIHFISRETPKRLKSGWEGNYEDGFGGTIEIIVVSNGDARFTINAGRGAEGAGGMIEGGIPVGTIKAAKNGGTIGDFVEKNIRHKDGEQPTRLHFRRIGHFMIVESQHAERYAGRGWFDGIYIMRSSLKDE